MRRGAADAGAAAAALLLLAAATACSTPAGAVSLRSSGDAADAGPAGHTVAGPMDAAQRPALLEVHDQLGIFETLSKWLHRKETFASQRGSIIRDRRLIEVLPISNCSAGVGAGGRVPGFPGFQFALFGHFSNESGKHLRQNISSCFSLCLDTPGCNAFSFENNGPIPWCRTYTGKLPTYSRIARSYRKCAWHEVGRGICQNSDGIRNYTFTHEGWLPNGIVMDTTRNLKHCSHICDSFNDCTAFSWLKRHEDNGMKPKCLMYTSRRAMKSEALAYTRCFLHYRDTLKVQPPLELSEVLSVGS